MACWKSSVTSEKPCWDGFREILARLPAETFPGVNVLNAALAPGTVSGNGRPVRFVASADLPDVPYEKHIFETGQVSTREESWHDLFNALVWCRLPWLKAAMNALHYENLDHEKAGRRGRLRDGLTLFDESGVIVAGSNPVVLAALAARDWETAFITHRADWGSDLQVIVCGHAILEKFLAPYKSITAHAVLLKAPGCLSVGELDGLLGRALREHRLFESSTGLSPLPLMGIPGWWAAGEQDPAFYRDTNVFRPMAEHQVQAPVYRVEDL